ncbi:MAG: SAM-dependent methyltransferase [Gemmatimonadales bacterium]|jgi:methyltransferase (TIGR00027 family)
MPDSPITHVSDTARWVAMYRAMETDRPDALFRDPYARRLAGEKGAEIIRTMRRVRSWAWPHIVRTATFDELILRCVADGADAVLNLAAGLDARPWRLDLPSALTWINVDYLDMAAYVREQLAAERPRCVLRWEPADLADDRQRRALFARVGAAHRKVLVVSEGLLIYLGAEGVAKLADDLHAQPTFHRWIFDISSPRLLKMMRRSTRGQMAEANAEFLFAPAENTAFFVPHGWREVEFRGSMSEAIRLKRLPRLYHLFRLLGLVQTRKRREEWNRFAGCALMDRV